MSRVSFALCSVSLALAIAACVTQTATPRVPAKAASSSGVTLVSMFDLPKADARARELSGITWDPESHRLLAVSDATPVIVPLTPNAALDAWSQGPPVSIQTMDAWDGEGIALAGPRIFVANEAGPHIYELDRAGQVQKDLPLPPVFAECVPNKCIESLSLSPDSRFLFFANESALTVDGALPTCSAGTVVRIVRRDLGTGADLTWAYATEPIFSDAGGGDMGVSDVAALSPTSLLVLERSFVPGEGVSARIFHVTLDPSQAQGPRPFQACAALEKTLVVDLVALTRGGAARGDVANYEGLALGPAETSGDRLLFVISDDNARPDLPTRLLTLRIPSKDL